MPGRELSGVYYAMDFLRQQNKAVAGDRLTNQTLAKGKHVVVIGGGDTGSDCVGTSNRHGAASVTQFELMPQPPESENKSMTWPYWPLKLRTSSSHEEGCERDWSVTTKLLKGSNGKVEKLVGARVEWFKDEATGQMKMREVEGSEFEIKADLVLLAMGFVSPVQTVLDAFGVDRDARGNVRANTDDYRTSVEKVFAAGDMRRGQSLVVWAIREGRQRALGGRLPDGIQRSAALIGRDRPARPHAAPPSRRGRRSFARLPPNRARDPRRAARRVAARPRDSRHPGRV